MSPGKLTAGTIFIITGIIFLLNNFGVLSWGVWFSLANLWPVLLIALGLSLIFRGSVLSLLGPLVILGAVAFAVAKPDQSFAPIGEWSWNSKDYADSGSFDVTRPLTDSIKTLEMDIDFGGGNLSVNGGSDALYTSNLHYRGRKPRETFKAMGNTGKARFSQNNRGSIGVQNWDILLTDKRPVELSVNAGACKADLDLSTINLSRLEMDCGASSIDLRLPMPKQKVEVSMESGATSIELRLPKGAEARVKIENVVSSTNIDQSVFDKDGKYWVTPGYNKASRKYDIDISNGVGSVNIKYEGDSGSDDADRDWDSPEDSEDSSDV